MAFGSVGLTNALLACLVIVNLIVLLLLYRGQKKS
jgi:hypothetical protein